MSTLKIVAAAISSIPLIVVLVGMAPVVALLSIPPLLLLLFQTEDDGAKAECPDQVIITGGSSGIGLGIAKECVARQVPKITLIARNRDNLQQAQQELQALPNCTSRIDVISVSVTDYEALTKVAKDQLKIPKSDRVVLWNCAGFSYPSEFEKVPVAKLEQQVMTNQLGTMYLVRALLPYLHQGCIVLTSSAAGQLGVYGYTSYAPTKYALRGFADTLHAELMRSHPKLSIQLAFPLDTNTPGYQEELKTAPAITKKLSESGGLVDADQTAKAMVDAAFTKHPKFSVYFTLEGYMLSTVTAGMSPVTSLLDAVSQVTLGGLFRLVGLFILNDWWNIIRTFPTEADEVVKSGKKGD